MAELNTGASNEGATRKIRSKKLSSRVDFTAMVDLAFLLITFFMLTTSLSKPQAMDLTMPADGESSAVDENRTMTVLIGENGQLKSFMGMAANAKTKDLKAGTSGFRQEILANKKKALVYSASIGKPERGLIVLIKPGVKSNYRSLVDVLDEMAISGVQTYAITDLTKEEKTLLKQPAKS